MSIKLIKPIETYFQAANAHDSTLLSDCFAEDAVVQDEGHEYQGLAEIKEWNETMSKKYDLTLEVISVARKKGQIIVTAQASGSFEGSPTIMEFYFTVENEKITFLCCG